jgi:hypothetical protein
MPKKWDYETLLCFLFAALIVFVTGYFCNEVHTSPISKPAPHAQIETLP